MDPSGVAISEFMARPYVVAEVASAHEGSVERAKAIARAACDAGADAVKFQVWSRDEGVTPDHPDYETLGRIEFSPAQWGDILENARALGLTVAADVDDQASMNLALAHGVELLKIRTSNLAHHAFLTAVAAVGKPILLAVGAATTAEIETALRVLDDKQARQVVLLHGFQAFPTQPGDTHLRTLGHLRQRYGRPVGYADHADGDSPLAFLLPAAALAAGACLIEKHITLDREKRTEDYESSLNPPDFARLIEQLRQVWAALGSAQRELTPAEQKYRLRFNKCIVARRDIAAGSVIETGMLAFKRSGKPGLPPDEAHRLIGKRTARPLAADAPLRTEDMR